MKVGRLLAALAAFPLLVQAQELAMDAPVGSMDIFRGVISQVGQTQNGWTVCVGNGDSVGSVRPVVEAELKRTGVQGLPTPNQVIEAMAARFPCPFVPYRSGLRPAEAKDLEGAWLSPEHSQKLTFPPRSTAWNAERAMPLKCQGVGHFPEGEARLIEIRGAAGSCPVRKAEDFATARANPRVVSWTVPAPGRLVIARTDVPNHVEEWEVFVVESGFEFAGIAFKAGDVVEYLRKAPGVSRSYAAKFRHLQKLQ